MGWLWFTRPFIEISFRPDKVAEQRYVLKVTRAGNKLNYVFLQNNIEVEEGQILATESIKLMERLREERAWELPEEETGDPDADFYAELTIDGHHSSCHGLTRAHTPVFQALLNDHNLEHGIWRAFKACALANPKRKVNDPKAKRP